MPSRDLQPTPVDDRVTPAWEMTPWQPAERVVVEVESDEEPLPLSDEHVIELSESESIRRA